MTNAKLSTAVLILLTFSVISAGPVSAQEAPAADRQQGVQAARYGAALGLPKDGDKLYLPDDAYPHSLLPPGNDAYAHIDGRKMKGVVEEITAISRRSRDDGNQYWGRIPGTPYDRMTADWVAAEFRKIGLENVRRQELEMKPLWFPDSWKAEVIIDGKATTLTTTFPINGTVGTGREGLTAKVVWGGLGTAADFQGRDIRNRVVLIYSIPTPGGRDHSAAWSGAMRRANEAGAAAVFVIMGFPGNALSNPEGADGTRAPTFTISVDEGNLIRSAIEKGEEVNISLSADIKEKEGLKTANILGTLPGASDETVLIMAHTDAFFEGAMDNASGVAMMLEIARHYAAIPRAQRRRTIAFLTTPDHHHGGVGIRWVREHFDFSKTALIVNCEHPSQTLLYMLNAGIMTSNAVSARRWYAGGSNQLKSLVTNTFKEFGVSVYTLPERRPGGELSQIFDKAPSFHIIDHVIYHTTLDTSQLVPASGMEAATRAFLKIIDGANTMSMAELR